MMADGALARPGRASRLPTQADTHFRRGLALELAGEMRAAVEAYDRASARLPRHPEAWYRAGALLFTLGDLDAATSHFRRAATAGPKTTHGRLGKARALMAEGDHLGGEHALRQTLALDGANAIALDLLGNLLAEAGHFQEARDCFLRAINAAPLMAGSYDELVRCRQVNEQDGDLLGRIGAALSTPGLDAAQRVRLHLAAGKAADDLGDTGTAMWHFDNASSLRSQYRPFDAALFDAELRRLAAHFSPGRIHQAGRVGIQDRTPILILGLPRSGTTLVEQILSAHPDVAGGGELNFWNERGAASLQRGVDGTGAAFLAQAATDYARVLRAINAVAPRVTDKLPFNVIWAGLIHLACPGATLIHCRRSPIDTALSIHQTNFNPHLAMPTGGEALVGYVRSIHRLAAHWRAVLPSDRFVEIEYEALTTNPELVIGRILAACGLGWSDACLHPERNPRRVSTPSKWQARQPIHAGSVQKWRRFEPWLGPLRALL
jgi:tetratricopeptide (TPR) repeat protein